MWPVGGSTLLQQSPWQPRCEHTQALSLHIYPVHEYWVNLVCLSAEQCCAQDHKLKTKTKTRWSKTARPRPRGPRPGPRPVGQDRDQDQGHEVSALKIEMSV